MRLKISQLIFCLLIFSCNKSNNKQNDEKPIVKTVTNKQNIKPIKIELSEPTIALISNFVERGNYNTSSLKMILFQNNLDIVKQIQDTLKKYKVNHYSCCNTNSPSQLTFYDNKSLIHQKLYVDTSFKKDQIVLIPRGYQYRYELPLKTWLNIKSLFNNAVKMDFLLFDISKARQIFKKAKKDRLLIINKEKGSDMWPYFDGKFTFNSIKVGDKEETEETENNIYSSYPKDSFLILSTHQKGWTRQVESIGESYWEKAVTISSDSSFYNSFKLYSPKTFFKKYNPQFALIGSSKEIESYEALTNKK
jgi:hypothetical protein